MGDLHASLAKLSSGDLWSHQQKSLKGVEWVMETAFSNLENETTVRAVDSKNASRVG